MGRNFSGRDVWNWKVVSYDGKVLNYPAGHPKEGRPMNDLDGYESANALAFKVGGMAVRA